MPSANNEAKAPATEMSEDLPLFFRAPGGTSVGTAVHDWIENWDFTEPDPELLREQFKHNTLPELREDPKDWSLVFADLFRRLRHQRLPGLEELRLAELCEDPSGSEWRFHLPLGNQFCAARIADCFETHAPEAQRPYADALRTLSDGQFKGYLEGFIDRLFRNGDGLGLIDWKTNKLGDTLDDYNEASLLRCAMESHYLLQMHLYLVALRRYQHALGLTDAPPPCAWLVFVRAVQVDGTRGVLRVNPSEEFLAALDPLFATPSVVNS